MSFAQPKTALALLLSTLSVATLYSPNADACGGLFCSNVNPVNQAAERIIFAKNDDGTVSAAIEILYQGPTEKFAWVLPVPPGDIDVKVSSKQALDALQQASNPQYQLQTTFEDGCDIAFAGAPGAFGATAGAPQQEAADSAPAVEVVAAGNAGPYDWQQIEVNPDLDDRADVAVNWLDENGYDVSALGPDTLRPYLDEDMNLVAFKLSKNSNEGSIRPVLINYQGDNPTIPIRPTAVAANEDMGVMVWVLGEDRAVSTNYYNLELNEALIDWFNPNPTYNDVVIAAADEAGGWGFVTEQSGPAANFSEGIYPSYKAQQWADFRVGQFDSIEAFLLKAQALAAAPFTNPGAGFGGPLGGLPINSGQPQYDGFLDLLSDPDVVPLREGATPEQFNACVSCYFEENVAVRTDAYPSTDYDPETDPLLDMDVQAFLDKMEELVIAPLADTRALFDDHAQATRLYTTLSPDEMVVDPVFDFNADLEDVNNIHQATQVMLCSEDAMTEWQIELPQGMVVAGDGRTWPITLDSGLPVNFRIVQMSTQTQGEVVGDNTQAIADQLLSLGVGDVTEDFQLGEPMAVPDMTPEDANQDPVKPSTADSADGGTQAPDETDTPTKDQKTTAQDTGDGTSSSGNDNVADAGAEEDTGGDDMMTDTDSGSKSSSGGCSLARTSPPQGSYGAILLLALGALFTRRRRQ